MLQGCTGQGLSLDSGGLERVGGGEVRSLLLGSTGGTASDADGASCDAASSRRH